MTGLWRSDLQRDQKQATKSIDAEDASDMTQEFFTRAIEKSYFATYDSERARFCQQS